MVSTDNITIHSFISITSFQMINMSSNDMTIKSLHGGYETSST